MSLSDKQWPGWYLIHSGNGRERIEGPYRTDLEARDRANDLGVLGEADMVWFDPRKKVIPPKAEKKPNRWVRAWRELCRP